MRERIISPPYRAINLQNDAAKFHIVVDIAHAQITQTRCQA